MPGAQGTRPCGAMLTSPGQQPRHKIPERLGGRGLRPLSSQGSPPPPPTQVNGTGRVGVGGR